MPIWPFYLIASIAAIRWNPHMGIAFSLHLLAMQGVKLYNPVNEQIFFMACHTASALFVAVFLDKAAGGFLALISLVYCLFVFGFIGHVPKLVIAEGLFILGLIVGSVNGNSGTLLGIGNNLYPDRFARGVFNIAFGVEANRSVLQKDQNRF